MTEQEFSELFDDEDEALMGELRASLTNAPVLELPADFARRTAGEAEQRFAQLSGLTRLAVRLEPVLSAPIGSGRAFPWTLALLGLTGGAGLLGQHSAGRWGITLLLVVLLWKALSRLCFPSLRGAGGPRWAAPPALYHLLPLLCVVASSVFCGGFVAALGLFSINYRSAGWNVVLLGPAAGAAVGLFLLSALTPTWRALAAHSIGRPRWLFPVQSLHGLWLGGLSSLFLSLWDGHANRLIPVAVCLTLAWMVSLVLAQRSPVLEEGRPALWRALHKSLRSLVIGGLPVTALLVAAYEATLTRRLEQPQLAEQVLQEQKSWVAQQQSIAPGENGWTVVRSTFLNRERDLSGLDDRLRAGRLLYDQHVEGSTPAPAVAVQKAHRDFREGLKIIDQALARPAFSYVATQGFGAQTRVPNYLLARSVSQGLSALTREAASQRRSGEGLRYLETNLRWSTCFREGALIGMMIGLAQSSLALENVERWIFEAKPDRSQLTRLLTALDRAQPEPSAFGVTMKREIYFCDLAFRELLLNAAPATPLQVFGEDEAAWKVLTKILPRSYWESEHKAYLNLQLSRLQGWDALGRPENTDSGEYLPFSYAARQMVPNSGRAEAQFLWGMTRFEALRTVVALEIYKSDRGAYPPSLQELVPAYLPHLPKNAISPNVWQRKPSLTYQRDGAAYRLTCQSPLLKTVQLKSPQVFGPDGRYEVERLNP
jgi:hypothetical protein